MSVYTFESEDGFRIEREFAAMEVPDLIAVDGRVYLPLFGPSPSQAGPPQPPIVKDHDHVAYGAARRWAGNDCNPAGGKLGDHYDKWTATGAAVIQGAEDKRRFQKACKTVWPRRDWKYDPS